MEHISRDRFLPGIRKYEFNPKHKVNVGWGSEMPLSDEDAQKLLNIALPIDGDQERHLVAAYKGKYYSFRKHHGNCYHGYLDNTMPQNYRMVADLLDY